MYRFQLFDAVHWTVLGLDLLLFVLLYAFRRRLRKGRARRWIPPILGTALLLLEGGGQLFRLATGTVDPRYTLPLHLCDLSLLLAALMLFTRKESLFRVTWFLGLGGASQALLTPNLEYGFPQVLFFQFFASHSLVAAACLWGAFVEGWKPDFRSVLQAFAVANLAAALVYPVNLALGSDYFFLNGKPASASLLDLLGPWPWYLIPMEGIVFLVFVLLWLPFAHKKTRRR